MTDRRCKEIKNDGEEKEEEEVEEEESYCIKNFKKCIFNIVSNKY